MNATKFFESVSKKIDLAEALATSTTEVFSGIFRIKIRFANYALATNYIRAFLPPQNAQEEFSLTLVSSADIELSDLIPNPSTQSRSYLDNQCFLNWSAGDYPILYLFDRQRRRGLVWLASGTAPAWELSRPGCPLISVAGLNSPWTAVHGAAIGREGKFLFLAGKGHSGKTTAALSCMRSGWDYAGDDYLYINSLTAMIKPLYSSARLRDDMAVEFSSLLEQSVRTVSNDFGEIKHELELSRMMGPKQHRGGHICAILLPRRKGAQQVEFTPARHADAFHAMFTSTSFAAPGSMKYYAKNLSKLAACAPVFFVDTGPDTSAIPGEFDQFMKNF